MSIGSDEQPLTAADRLNAALVLLTGCIGSSFDDICTYGLISGDTYVPFDPDPEDAEDNENCDDYGCGQVWVRIESINAITPDSWENNCSITFRVEIEVGVIRCFEVPDGGEAPTASAMLGYAMQSNEDMNRIFCAAMGCDDVEDEFDKITAGSWLPLGPMGGQYGGTWSFTLETL